MSVSVFSSKYDLLTGSKLTIKQNETLLVVATTADLLNYYEQFFNLLDEIEKECAHRFRFPYHKDTYVISHGLLRHLIGVILGKNTTGISFKRFPNGKPYIDNKNTQNKLHFSLSHSEHSFCIAFQWNHALGADIELIRSVEPFQYLIQTHFSSQEKRQIQNSSDSQEFFKLWTQKEAIGKVSGQGIVNFKSLTLPHGYNLHTSIYGSYVVSVCHHSSSKINTVVRLDTTV
jgi:4'-phosphopantetheinyl transferase